MKIGIIGLGFVGLSFAVVLGLKGYQVLGIDKNIKHLELVKQGKSSFFEKDLEKFLKIGIKKKLKFDSSICMSISFSDSSFFLKTRSACLTLPS